MTIKENDRLTDLRKSAGGYYDTLALSMAGGYLYLAHSDDIPAGAIDSYSYINDTDRCLCLIRQAEY